ncbi:uncharacterized protein FIBRA_07612 [Fibroporia radiculosa]|uniref:Heterokaryon incompatibility domain-containing protein n=1 Tax=Fibroporia radiculosa TaxID=599839 RepID=J4IBX0_9APHY|nr:uncharacterized protein FIBRA_07612 [Fibroporia radiculosa]CCM05396.1 predicted protein [Fibroporia radiculosa]
MEIWGCDSMSHKCGNMVSKAGIYGHRCVIYARDYDTVTSRASTYASWPKIINPSRVFNGVYARPLNCIHKETLIRTENTSDPYIAVSYVWDPDPVFTHCQWVGRSVTTQALQLAARLGAHTSLPLWIDAICIPQNDTPESTRVKLMELAKMADIYRGALGVLCIVPEVDDETCTFVEHSAAMLDMDGYRMLEQAGDAHGAYMFASRGGSDVLRTLYGSRWWTRAWTFQEAVLNSRTFLVGNNEESIPVQDVLKIAGPIARRAATQKTSVLGQSSRFWDAAVSMAEASRETMPLAEAMASVWRRQCTVLHDMVYSVLGVCQLQSVIPAYDKPFGLVLKELVEAANAKGDYSWLRWAHLMKMNQPSHSLVPRPQAVFDSPASSITRWHSVPLPGLPPARGDSDGVSIPHRSIGVVRWQSDPLPVREAIPTLEKRGHNSDEIWDLIFGMQVGLASDMDRVTGGSGISRPLLSLTVAYLEGTAAEFNDHVGERPFTPGIGFTNYASMAAKVWQETKLIILCSQGGTTVVRENGGSGKARIHKLPIISEGGVPLGLVVYDNNRYNTEGIGVVLEIKGTGHGAWQLTAFSASQD